MTDQNFVCLLREGFPARLDSSHAAKLLGFGAHDLPVLIAAALLKPLGSPAANSPKMFALVDILALAADRDWLHRATKTLGKHWQRKNEEQRRKRRSHGEQPNPVSQQSRREPLSAELSASGQQKQGPVVT